MVTLQNSLYKKHAFSDTNNDINKNLKKVLKMNKIKKNKHFIYDMCNHSEHDNFKRNLFSFSQYEEQIVPMTQNNGKGLIKFQNLKENSNDFNSSISDEESFNENSLGFQYGTLFGNEKVVHKVKNFLSNWSSFVSDMDEDHSPQKEEENDKEKRLYYYDNYKKNVIIDNNTGYLTPTSQKDDDCSYEGNLLFDQENEESDDMNIKTEEEEFLEYSPIVVDDFDDFCPFENDYNEDERIRKVLNAKVLPNDYIGKIPSIPERPIGDLGRLMDKFNF